jgi:hypothetical protein
MQKNLIVAIAKLATAVRENYAVTPCTLMKISPTKRALPCTWKPTDISKIASDIAIKAKTQQLSPECVEQIIRSFSDTFNMKCGNMGKGMYSGAYQALRSDLVRRGIIKTTTKTSKPKPEPTYTKPSVVVPDSPRPYETIQMPNVDIIR